MPPSKNLFIVMTTALLILTLFSNANAADRYVDGARGNNLVSNTCVSKTNPCKTIQKALSHADSSDKIKVHGLSFYGPIEIYKTGPVYYVISIEGSWNSTFTERSSDMPVSNIYGNNNRAFDIRVTGNGGDRMNNRVMVNVSGFGMYGGKSPADEDGGAIYAQVTNEGMLFLNLSNNIIANNTASRYGGGISAYNYYAYLEANLYNNFISDNTSGSAGGGVMIFTYGGTSDAPLKFKNNIITGNTNNGGLGAGIALYNHGWMSADIVNNTIVDNSSYGIALDTSGSSSYHGIIDATILNSIIKDNGSNQDLLLYPVGDFADITVNASYSNIGRVIDASGSISGSSVPTYNDNGNNLNLDPGLRDPQNDDFHLRFDSPMIDAGQCGGAAHWLDFEGDSRPSGPGCDIGADEFSGPIIQTTPTALDLGYVATEYGTSTKTLTVTNVGYSDLTYNRVSDWGSGSNYFTASYSGSGNTCSQATLAPGESCTIDVTFTSLYSTGGTVTATLGIHTDAVDTPIYEVPLTAVAAGYTHLYVPPADGTIYTGTPTFLWSAVKNATQYRLQVKPVNGSFIFDEVVQATCSSNTCSFEYTGAPLQNGTYIWYVQTSGESWGYSTTTGPIYFTVAVPDSHPANAMPWIPLLLLDE
jgi:hypothetical protein